ncbi:MULTISPECIES: hypothetical protein [unclassified Corynebacterium]|uniref:hypothetical protein n=1 Tax=unclassified Corynebacterium TaxID=2624378 RepID=UPI0029CA4AC9|nr:MULTISPECIES: hypothetical protein [unclassified Corynebacterium]WPF65369.1 hypothetical protein OLX12_07205 [Corynebacterium sp. 22KM0430]WPF67864.1 hypothetical protein OLW90_07195 [Corynebacterium sp. 21KM1197]
MNTDSAFPSRLLDGPRGRRFALEYALASEATTGASTHSLFSLAHGFTPFTPESGELAADILALLPLAPVTPELLRRCLISTTEAAAYWQEPDTPDLLAATAPVRRALERVARHLGDSPHFRSWWAPRDVRSQEQWVVDWEDRGFPPPLPENLSPLVAWRATTLEREERAAREKPRDPRASYGDCWWSIPHFDTPATMPPCFDGTPSGLYYVEDSLGWARARTRRAVYPPVSSPLNLYRIDSAEDWASLCSRFPLEVTAITRHDWYRTTGRDGRWVIPDWAQVARHYHAVRLTLAGYLSGAGTAIPVEKDTASVIAGWHPDQTYWFTPLLRYHGKAVSWESNDSGWTALSGDAGTPDKSGSNGS